jgi:cytoskeletal protein CcmA (bactofilin family)/ribosomal protein L40E
MPPPKKDTIRVTCPKCGHAQPEPRGAYSTHCKKCKEHFRIEEALNPTIAPQKPDLDQRQVTCFQCGAELRVAPAAESTMCRKCSSHVDLRDYQITQTVSKNFRTHGRLVIEEKGYLLNTDSQVGEAVVKGKVIGKLVTARSLEIHSTANFKGTFSAGRLIVPAGNHFRWAEMLRVGAAEIGGELAANLHSAGTVVLKSTARFFGQLEAGGLVVESGAVFVGQARVGSRSSSSSFSSSSSI